MRRLIADRVFIAVGALWLGTLLLAGAAAAVLFPMIKGMGVEAERYAMFAGEHWRLVAGRPANVLFVITMGAGALVVPVGMAALVVSGMGRTRSFRWRVRLLSFLGLALVFAAGSGLVFLRMQTQLSRFEQAAAIGDTPRAQEHSEQFRAMHPWATRAIAGQVALLLVSIALAIADVPGRRPRGEP